MMIGAGSAGSLWPPWPRPAEARRGTGPPVLNEDEQAALAEQAAAGEAADMEAFGGNAAAGETGNAFVGEVAAQGDGAAVPGPVNLAR